MGAIRRVLMAATLLVPALLVSFVMAQRPPMSGDDYAYISRQEFDDALMASA
jgi:hypothetical protein